MPFFSNNKFLPKKTPQRKISYNFPKRKPGEEEDLKFDFNQIKLNVGEQSAVFEDGEWIPENGVSGHRIKEQQRLKQQLHQLETENNFLKLKNEVLLDMGHRKDSSGRIDLKDISIDIMTSKKTKFTERTPLKDIKQNTNKLKHQEIFEKTFRVLKGKRESLVRLERIKCRCISEADMDEVLKFLNKEVRMKSSTADIPPLEAERPQCHERWLCHQGERLDAQNNFGIRCEDAKASFQLKNKMFWETFKECPKDFEKLAACMNRTVNDCVYYYYLKRRVNKCTINQYNEMKKISNSPHKTNNHRIKFLKVMKKARHN